MAGPPVDRPMPTEVIDGAYDITVKPEPQRYRAYLIDADVPTLFDAGFADTTDVLTAGIEAVGLEPERVIVTHEDHDHTGGLAAIADAYDAETWAPADDAEAIVSGYGYQPERTYEHGDTIGPYEAVHVPGHTPGASVLIHREEDYAVTGDVVVGATQRGLPPGYLLPPPAVFSDDPDAAEQNLDVLADYDFEAALPFHGEAVTEGASEKIERYARFPGHPMFR